LPFKFIFGHWRNYETFGDLAEWIRLALEGALNRIKVNESR